MDDSKVKYGEYMGFRLTKELDERLEAYCETRGLYRAQVIRWAIEEHLDRKEEVKEN